MTDKADKVRTEDGVEVGVGEPAYDYYSMKPGHILEMGSEPRTDAYYGPEMQGSLTPWFTFQHTDPETGNPATRQLLNGQRICSVEAAKRKGWLK